jgi:hypothetical protein
MKSILGIFLAILFTIPIMGSDSVGLKNVESYAASSTINEKTEPDYMVQEEGDGTGQPVPQESPQPPNLKS